MGATPQPPLGVTGAAGSFTPAVPLRPTFKTQDAGLPQSLLVTNNDTFVVLVLSSVVGTLSVSMRVLLADGTISLSTYQYQTSGNRFGESHVGPMPDGFLIGASISFSGSKGQAYVQAYIVRSFFLANAPFIGILAQGYPYFYKTLFWPGSVLGEQRDLAGNIRSITGSVPGAGAEINEVVPANAVWRLLAFKFSLTTAVTVATRIPHFVLDDGANGYYEKPAQQGQLASLTVKYQAATGDRDIATNDTVANTNLPSPLMLPGGHRIRTLTTAIQAGDQYTAPQYLVEEWISG